MIKTQNNNLSLLFLPNMVKTREFVIEENIREVYLLDLTADFGVKTNTKLTPDCQRERERETKTGAQNCLYTVILVPTFSSSIY